MRRSTSSDYQELIPTSSAQLSFIQFDLDRSCFGSAMARSRHEDVPESKLGDGGSVVGVNSLIRWCPLSKHTLWSSIVMSTKVIPYFELA